MTSAPESAYLFYALVGFCAVVGMACVLNVIAMRGYAGMQSNRVFALTEPLPAAIDAKDAQTSELAAIALLDVIPECSWTCPQI
jgi:hypothetical protein